MGLQRSGKFQEIGSNKAFHQKTRPHGTNDHKMWGNGFGDPIPFGQFRGKLHLHNSLPVRNCKSPRQYRRKGGRFRLE